MAHMHYSMCVCECVRGVCVCEGVQGGVWVCKGVQGGVWVCKGVQGGCVSVQLWAHSCLCMGCFATRFTTVPGKAWPWISQVRMLLHSFKPNQTKIRDSLCIQNHLLPASSSHEPPKMQKELYQCLWSLEMYCCCHHASPGSPKSVTSLCSCSSG